MKITNYPNQNYFVVVAYGRRRQMEANKERLEKEYPQGKWWTTAELVHEYRVYQEKIDWDYICNLEPSEIEKEADRKIEENRSAELLKRAGKIIQGEVA